MKQWLGMRQSESEETELSKSRINERESDGEFNPLFQPEGSQKKRSQRGGTGKSVWHMRIHINPIQK